MKVLFLGNSHTFYNDMPATFADLYEAATGERPDVTLLAHPGKRWDWHWHEYYELRFNLMYGNYDYCIIQQEAHPFPGEEITLETGKKIIALCKECGVKPVVSMTWAEKAYPEHQQIMCDTYEKLAQETDGILSPVGRIWEKVRQEAPDIELYYKDDMHASVYGSYLAAMSHCCIISGKTPIGLPVFGRDDFRYFMPDEERDGCEVDKMKTLIVLNSDKCRRIQEIAAKEL